MTRCDTPCWSPWLPKSQKVQAFACFFICTMGCQKCTQNVALRIQLLLRRRCVLASGQFLVLNMVSTAGCLNVVSYHSTRLHQLQSWCVCMGLVLGFLCCCRASSSMRHLHACSAGTCVGKESSLLLRMKAARPCYSSGCYNRLVAAAAAAVSVLILCDASEAG